MPDSSVSSLEGHSENLIPKGLWTIPSNVSLELLLRVKWKFVHLCAKEQNSNYKIDILRVIWYMNLNKLVET